MSCLKPNAWLLGLLALLAGGLACANTMITGTATYRERMLLPPAAVLEVTLEDISRADAPASVLGRARIESPGAPPIRFAIAYDPAAIAAGHRYVVRARVNVDGKPMFVTDTAHPVLDPSGATHVDLVLKRVGSKPRSPAPAAPAATQRMRGVFTYMADAGLFVDCASGRKLPVAQEGDNAALEAAYSRARVGPAAPVLVDVDARVEMRLPMEGTQRRPTLVVARFVGVLPGVDCKALATPVALENTTWMLVQLRGAPVTPAEKQHAPTVMLQPGERRVGGFGGCNQFNGAYTLDGDRLAFSRMASTMKACVHGGELERAFFDALGQIERWRIAGQQLELLDARGEVVAAFAVERK